MKFIKDIATGPEPSPSFFSHRTAQLTVARALGHDHPRYRFPILFLFRRVELVRFQVHRADIRGSRRNILWEGQRDECAQIFVQTVMKL